MARRTTMDHFPYRKTLESFDYSVQPSVERKKFKDLTINRFLSHGENIVPLSRRQQRKPI